MDSLLRNIYELDGSTHDTAWTLKTYQEVTRIIFTVHRWAVRTKADPCGTSEMPCHCQLREESRFLSFSMLERQVSSTPPDL
uniref:Adenosine deaminase 2a n=1 Tax=Mastacembelus armatus TaxID=205130 RepID=A0A7N8YKY4_9TELE